MNTQSTLGLYRAMLNAAGSERDRLKRAIHLMVASACLNGIAYLGFYPVFNAIDKRDGSMVLLWLALMSVLMLCSIWLRWRSQEYEYGGYLSRASHELRSQVGLFLRQIPLQNLNKRRTGAINALIAGNIDEVLNYSPMVVGLLCHALLTPLVVGVGSLLVDWRLGVLLLLSLALLFPVLYIIQPMMRRDKLLLSNAHSGLNAQLLEFTQGLFVLKSAGALSSQQQYVQNAIEKVKTVQQQALKHETVPNVLLGAMLELTVVVLLLAGAAWIGNGSLAPIVVAALMAISARFAEPLTSFLSMVGTIEMVRTGYKELQKFMAQQPLPISPDGAKQQGFAIEFHDVQFSYQQDNGATRMVLQNINLHIPERSMLALVGGSGAGKTSLTRALMRYADVDKGSICIGKVDIRQQSTEALIANFSVVFQDVYLFDDSVANNIKMARPTASIDEVIAVAKRAKCHDFISALQEGYETKIGDIGSSLSGGERQRISIARALLKDAPIVILDEPTAQLDTYSELAVQQAIDELIKDRTVIVIAHRLSTIVGADNIAVLDKGEIVATGTHQELLQQNGQYSALWAAQQSGCL